MKFEDSSGVVRRHMTYANVMSTLAVFLVIAGGTALAAKQAVTSKQIKDNSITSKDLKDDEAVASVDVVDNSLTGEDIDESKLSLPPTPTSLPPNGPAGGALSGNYPNPLLGPSSVGSSNVTDNSLTGADIDESTLTLPPGGGGSPTGAAGGGLSGNYPNPSLAANSVGSSQVSANSLADVDIGEDSIGGDELKNYAVSGANINFGAVDNISLATGAVTGDKIGADAVKAAQLGTVNIVTSPPETIAAGTLNVVNVSCPASQQLLSGGYSSLTSRVWASQSAPSYNSGTGVYTWNTRLLNDSSSAASATAYALCLA